LYLIEWFRLTHGYAEEVDMDKEEEEANSPIQVEMNIIKRQVSEI